MIAHPSSRSAPLLLAIAIACLSGLVPLASAQSGGAQPTAPAPQRAAPPARSTAGAETSANASGLTPALRAEIARLIPGARPEDVRLSPVPNVFEVARGTDLLYVTRDGKYAFAGELFDVSRDENLSERRRRELRQQIIAAVPESQMLVFSPRDPKFTITVFTDIDCGFCRKMHVEMPQYNELGIRVRYLFFPRSGPDTESWDKAVSVWCSPNRNDALTRAKRGETIRAAKCGQTPVERDFELGREVGLRGTPAIILANGEMLDGYLPPALLARRLQGSAPR